MWEKVDNDRDNAHSLKIIYLVHNTTTSRSTEGLSKMMAALGMEKEK
jgi:hypothetical protein